MIEKTPYIATHPDPMMDELHAIRAQIQEEVKDMTIDEQIRYFHEQAVAYAADGGYELVPSTTHPQAYTMIQKADVG